MTNSEKTTGEKIKALRQSLGKNQGKIADELAISIPAYSKIETGIIDINLSRLYQIAALFGVSPAQLLPGADDSEQVKANYERYKQQIDALNNHFITLQRKLITAYEEIETLRANAVTN